MASVHTENRNGKSYRRIQFYNKDRKRRSIRLGRIALKAANTICYHVGQLVSSSISGEPLDRKTAVWLKDIGQDLADKLNRAGLMAKRESATIAGFTEKLIENKKTDSPNTIRNLRNSQKKLVDFFGENKNWREIKPGEADEWRQELVNNGYAEATISKAVKHARQFGRQAERNGLVDQNPFKDLKAGSESNPARLQFVDRDTIDKVIEACPDAQWRLIVALSRYGGLRCPSEHLALRWNDVDWNGLKLTIRSSKTGTRQMPIYPELFPYLQEVYELADPGTTYIISRYRQPNTNLRTQFLRIIERAGVEPWERLFHNLRASRQTELEDDHPSHAVAKWMGNSEAVAHKHYLQVTDAHFDKASGRGATGGAEVVQKPVPQESATNRKQQQKKPQPISGCGVMRSDADSRLSPHPSQVPPRGVEPLSSD